jgi:hypothetical protein
VAGSNRPAVPGLARTGLNQAKIPAGGNGQSMEAASQPVFVPVSSRIPAAPGHLRLHNPAGKNAG